MSSNLFGAHSSHRIDITFFSEIYNVYWLINF